jgi:hypothetical protein
MTLSEPDIQPRERRTLLAHASDEAGRAWAQIWFDDLRGQGRAVTGGWPGTMSEARGRARVHIDGRLSRQALAPITHIELGEAARATYDIAKSLWYGSRVRDEGVA